MSVTITTTTTMSDADWLAELRADPDDAAEAAEAADKAACAECGSTDGLVSIEESVEWRYVEYVLTDDGFEPDDDTWGDRVGDDAAQTVGVACQDCMAETRWPDDPTAPQPVPIVRLGDWLDAHPTRLWTVERWRFEAYDPPVKVAGDPVTVQARCRAEAMAAVNRMPVEDGPTGRRWFAESAVPA